MTPLSETITVDVTRVSIENAYSGHIDYRNGAYDWHFEVALGEDWTENRTVYLIGKLRMCNFCCPHSEAFCLENKCPCCMKLLIASPDFGGPICAHVGSSNYGYGAMTYSPPTAPHL